MAQGDFKDLIYQSTQTPVGIENENSVDRLLGIGTNGDATVVSIKGNSKVMVKGDVEIDYSKSNAKDDKVYSCKATTDFVEARIVNTAPSSDPDKATHTYSCQKIDSLIAGGGANIITDPNSETGNDEAVYSCKASQTLKSSCVQKADIVTSSTTGQDSAEAKVYSCAATNALNLWEANTVYITPKTSGLVLKVGSVLIGDTATLQINSDNTLHCDTTITATSFYENSDLKLKSDVRKVTEEEEEAANGIPFVSFNWKDSGAHSYGVTAQDVEKEFPELVREDDGGVKSVNYLALLCLKVAALERKVRELSESKEVALP